MSSILFLRGSTALSPFRIEKLLQKATSLQLPQTQLHTEYWYFIDTNDHLNEAEYEKLQSLLTAQCATLPEVQHAQQFFFNYTAYWNDFSLGIKSNQYCS